MPLVVGHGMVKGAKPPQPNARSGKRGTRGDGSLAHRVQNYQFVFAVVMLVGKRARTMDRKKNLQVPELLFKIVVPRVASASCSAL